MTDENPAIEAMRKRVRSLEQQAATAASYRDGKQADADMWEASRAKSQAEIDATLQAIELLEKAAEFDKEVT